jgi:hypothetical protein
MAVEIIIQIGDREFWKQYEAYASSLAASLNFSNSSSLTLMLIEIDFLIMSVPPFLLSIINP